MRLADNSLVNDPNIISYWKMENANDEKGAHNFSAAGVNPVQFNPARYGNGADFVTGGSGGFLTTAWGIGSGAFTFNTWIRNMSGGVIGATSEHPYIYSWDQPSGVKFNMSWYGRSSFFSDGANPCVAFIRDRESLGGPYIRYNTVMSPTDFTMLSCTFDGATMIGYLNGLAIGSVAASGSGSGGGGFSNQTAINYQNTGTTTGFSIADDSAVWSRALTPAELLSIWQDDTPTIII